MCMHRHKMGPDIAELLNSFLGSSINLTQLEKCFTRMGKTEAEADREEAIFGHKSTQKKQESLGISSETLVLINHLTGSSLIG